MAFLITRRNLICSSAALVPLRAAQPGHLATGVKVGEVTHDAARIWARRTRDALRRADGAQALRDTTRARVLPLGSDTSALEGSCPGDAGEMRALLRDGNGKQLQQTAWAKVGAASDYTHQFALSKLQPGRLYRYSVETRGSGRTDGSMNGTFQTAPAPDDAASVNLAMMSCQKYSQRDDNDGFRLYDGIRRFAPNFYLSVGDNVYYDSDDPKVNHVSIARHHWHRMYSLARTAECLRSVAGYWLKDDHDCYSDDCWPGMVNETMNPFTFDEGLKIFPEQAPMGARTYRSFQWGRGLEIFLMEGRDWRSSNRAPDGPAKSIWGVEQKRWLRDSLQASKAHWKLIVNPTPMVGPDRVNKHDNLSNADWAEEGNELRSWIQKNTRGDTFVLCGDRHWQYHSIHPQTKVQEYGCGAASDSHASGTPGENPAYHRFHRVKGGFLALQVRWNGASSQLVIEHRDVDGNRVYGQTYDRKG
ncbi:MAG: alkaline phosphatase D family protein [Candidatus Solibacter usitatus]|nr:alkaline phosphatase D family protein [Candidatus Solibacter usitatus]